MVLALPVLIFMGGTGASPPAPVAPPESAEIFLIASDATSGVATPTIAPTTTTTAETVPLPEITTTTTTPPTLVGNEGRFGVGPGLPLPSEAACAAQVAKAKENRPANSEANKRKGNSNAATKGNWGRNPGAAKAMQRVSGNYSGTTDEIIQWASCKWGFDVDTVRAQVMVESGWRQGAYAGYVVGANSCGDGSLRRPATTTTTPNTVPIDPSVAPAPAPQMFECPTAYGLMQLRSDYQPGSYPMSAQSTAYNLDYGLAMKRACYEGVGWLGAQTNGDAWGCVGVHYSGQWLDPAAKQYIEKVQRTMISRSWER